MQFSGNVERILESSLCEAPGGKRRHQKMSEKVCLPVELLPLCTIISDVCFMSELIKADLSLCYELLLLVAPALVGSVRPQNGGDLFVDKLFM